MAGITLDQATRLHLAEWLIVLLSLPDPVPPEAERAREIAALNIITATSKLVQNEAARESIQQTIAPLAEASTKQFDERIAASGRRTEALTASSGGVGLGSLSEWDLLAMVIASQRHGILHKVHE